MSKEERIIEEARKYVDAVRYFDDAGTYVNSVRQFGVARLVNAKDGNERKRISEEQRENIIRSIGEAQERISPPIIALNELVEASDEPVYSNHQGRDLMVVPHDEAVYSYRNFDVRPKDGGPETAL